MEFLFPERLALLLLLAPLLYFLVWAERIRVSRLQKLSSTASFQKIRIFTPLFSVALLCVSIARPYYGYHDIQIQAEGSDLMIAVDVSYSMLAKDVSPNRLEIAKRKIFDIIELAQKAGFPLRIGLVTFAGSAFRFCPLTSDLEITRTFTEQLAPDVMTSRGSSLEQAVNTSLQALAQVKSNHGAILILSDGEDLQFNVQHIESSIKASGVPIYTIGIGESEGVPIPINAGRYYANYKGDIVVTKLQEGSLTSLAQVSGGIYSRADLAGSDIGIVLQNLREGTKGSTASKTIRSYFEFGPWCVAPIALLTFVLLLLRRESILFAIAFISLGLCTSVASAEDTTPPPSPREAYEAYQRGDFETALRGFNAAHEKHPEDSAITQSLASAKYQLKQYEESAKLFDSLAAGAKSGRERYEATYNSGNSHLLQKKFDEAISRYEEALKVKPDDIPATANLKLAKQLKEEQQKQEQSSSQSSSSSSSQSSSQNSNSQNSSGQPTGSSSSSSENSSHSSSSQSSGGEKSSEQSQDQSANDSSSSSESEGDSKSDESSSTSGKPGSQDNSSSTSEQSSQSSSESTVESQEGKVPTPSAEPTKNPARELDSLEDRPLLPKQRRNRDNQDPMGQTW